MTIEFENQAAERIAAVSGIMDGRISSAEPLSREKPRRVPARQMRRLRKTPGRMRLRVRR